MILDILEFIVENNKNYLEKTVLVILSQTCRKRPKLSVKLLRKKFLKFRLSWGEFRPLRTLWGHLHMFLDVLEFRVANIKIMFRENLFEMRSQKSTKRTSFVLRILQRL